MQTDRSLADLLDIVAQPWFPEPGDLLGGEIIELETTDRGWGPYPVVTVRVTEARSTERGGNAVSVGSVRVWHAFGAVAKNKLKEQRSRVGDQLVARDLGVRPGKSYRDWQVKVVKESPLADGTVSAGVDVAGLIEHRMQPQFDAVSDQQHVDEQRYADMPRSGADTAQAGPGGEIPYR